MKSLNNQNKIIYSIANKSGLRREIKNIKKIRERDSKKGCKYSSDSTSDDLDSDSSLDINSSWDNYSHPARRKEMNILDNVVTDNLNKNKGKINEAINNEPTFGTSSFNLSSGTSDPLPVVTVSL